MKRPQKITLSIITLMVFVLMTPAIQVFADEGINITLDGAALKFDVEPQIINGRTMVPLRAIFEAMGAEVSWDGSTQTVSAHDKRTVVISTIGKKELTVNGTPIELDVAPQIVRGRTLVPVRFVAESFGADVSWDADTRTASITSLQDTQYTEFTFEQTLYSVDGRTVTVGAEEVAAYKKVYWYEEPCIIMYSVDGRKSVVQFSDIEKQKNVGWYENPVTRMYAADGRTQVFKTENVEAQKSVGWYTYPVTTLYKQDGATCVVPTADVSKYTQNGWAEEPYVTLYTLYGRSGVFPESKVDSQKKVGWYEKDEIQLVKNKSKIGSLAYSDAKKGSVTGLITWQYNKYIGTKPDVGAKVMLVQTNKIPILSDEITFLTVSNDLEEDPTVISTTADGSGNYYFDNIPAGDYYLILQSKSTHASPVEADVCISDADQYLSDLISTNGLDNFKLGCKVWKTTILKITVKGGEITRCSKDWGYTYY